MVCLLINIPYLCEVLQSKMQNKPLRIPLFIIIMLLLTVCTAEAQQLRIRFLSFGAMMYSQSLPDIVRLTGNPVFEHDGAYLYCDSAWLNEVTNNVDCFGRVRIKSSDTLNLYGKFLHYDGNARIATIRDDVRLVDKQTTLTTDYMIYDRNTGIANYTSGGKMVNGDNVLTSRRCYYYTSQKLIYFRDDVVMTNPEYKINCDTLKYNTVSRVSYFLGPTIIKGKDNYIYCEDGEYDRENSKSRFSINALLVDESRRLTGDSLYYDDKLKYGKALRNVVMTDTVQDVTVRGNFAEYFKNAGFTYITGRAVAELKDEKDTLFIHADTLRATFDTTKNETRELFAYNNCKFFRKDLQGACDSLYYSFADSVINMYHLPILWSDRNQMTADTIKILTGKNTIKQMYLNSLSFIVSRDSTSTYNQIKGRNMVAYFKDNELNYIDVLGNAETVYYVREDDKSLMGVNAAQGSKMRLYINDSKIDRILYLDKPKGSLLPEENLTAEQKQLKGFLWREVERPLKSEDIFFDNSSNMGEVN